MLAKWKHISATIKLWSGLWKPFYQKNIFSPQIQTRQLNATVRHYGKKEKHIINSTVIVQDRISIKEMPCVIQIVNGEFEVKWNAIRKNGDIFEGIHLECNPIPKRFFKKVNLQEEFEMCLGFNRCNSVSEIINLLKICPAEEITSPIALTILKKLFRLEAAHKQSDILLYLEDSKFNFQQIALKKTLVEIICCSSDPHVKIDALLVTGIYLGELSEDLLEPLCKEIIVHCTDGNLSIIQICKLIKIFNRLGEIGKKYTDQVWVGISEKQDNITADDISCIIKILPLVKRCRPFLYNFIESKFPLVWKQISSEQAISTMQVLVKLELFSSRLLNVLSNWTSINLHTLSEEDVIEIVESFLRLKYTDEVFQRTIYRYLKAKDFGIDSIKDSRVVTTILEYCAGMRIRNINILDFIIKYFMGKTEKLDAEQIASIMIGLGNLNYIPCHSNKVFDRMEKQMNQNFASIPPKIIIELMLSCIYLKRYSLNFMTKIFESHFLDRLILIGDSVNVSCEKLIIFDYASKIEVSNYSGPYLPINLFQWNVQQDARIEKCINILKKPLIDIIGNPEKIIQEVIPESLPKSKFYIIDLVADCSENQSFSGLENKRYAFLIHLPVHLDVTNKIILGPQAMKMRLLEKLGYTTIGFNYNTVIQLKNNEKKLKDLIKQKILFNDSI